MMFKRTIQLLLTLLGAMVGGQLYDLMDKPFMFLEPVFDAANGFGGKLLFVALGALLGFAVATWGTQAIIGMIRGSIDRLAQVPGGELGSGLLGLIVGLLASFLVYPPVAKISGADTVIPLMMTLLFGYIGFQTGYLKKDEIVALLASVRGDRGKQKDEKGFEEHKILDTSVIIDGRIADICKTGFIEGTLVIPEFVLEELQHIADSSDLLKRNRGRRGLDILNRIQKELDVKVLIYDGDFEDISEVDSKLVRLAKALQGKVVTNDFNLNKVCELQGVSVLNINDLANAVKPVVLPGEEILVQVIKDGKEHGQGVAYLDDGTMIVVEGGREYIGTTMEVLVTSVLQTSAGRMIFAKPKLLEKAL